MSGIYIYYTVRLLGLFCGQKGQQLKTEAWIGHLGLQALTLGVAACFAACSCPAWKTWLPQQPLQLQSAWPFDPVSL